MSKPRPGGPFRTEGEDPHETRARRRVYASKLLTRALYVCDRYATRVAAELGIGEHRIRQMTDPEEPSTIGLCDLLGLPEDMAVFIANAWMALYNKRVADLPTAGEEESPSEFAREISQTSSGAINAILDETAPRAAKLQALRVAIGVYERATAQLLQATKEADNVRPIKGGNGDH